MHIHAACHCIKFRPIDYISMASNKHGPIDHMPNTNLLGGKMCSGMAQEKERIESGRRKINTRTSQPDHFSGYFGIFFQEPFYIPIRGMGMYIQKIVMIFDQNSVKKKNRMMMFIFINLNTPLVI